MEMLKELGRRIQKARKVKKLTQQELADLSHVSLKHVQSCERGEKNPSFEVLRAFGKVLNLSLDSLMNLDLPEDEQSANDMRQLYLSCPPAARKALLNSARALADELKEMTQADECDQDKKAEEKYAGGGIKIPHRLFFCRYSAVRLSGCVQQTRQLLQPAPDAVPHTAAVGALNPGDLGHRHAQVKPGVDAPGLDGGQLHQRGIHFFPQLLLFQNFLRGERPVDGIAFNAILPVQRVMGLVPELPALVSGIVLLVAPDRGQDFLGHVYKDIGFICIVIQVPKVDLLHDVPPFQFTG